MHLHGQIIILRADVLGQKVNRLCSAIPNPDLGPRGKRQQSVPVTPCSLLGLSPGAAHLPQLGLLQVEVVLLLLPRFEVFCLLLPLQHLQLLLTHRLLPLSLQAQLLHLPGQRET